MDRGAAFSTGGYQQINRCHNAAERAEAILIRAHHSPELVWWGCERGLKDLAFPSVDFYRDFRFPSILLEPFVLHCLAKDPRLLSGELDPLFRMPTIELTMDLTPHKDQYIVPEELGVRSSVTNFWYIPVYPGMTAKRP